jgi:HK97 gp10 family phage protein
MAKVEGRGELKRKFAAMPRAVREEVKAALVKSADELVGMQKRLVPVKTGALRDSIHYEIEDDGLRATVTAGDKEAFYARFVEFGTPPHENQGEFKGSENPGAPARPFFFVSYRALRKPIKSRLSRAITAGIKKVAKGG